MHTYNDSLYGAWTLDPRVNRLVECPTFQRLRGISQSGASKYAHLCKTVTRFEHSLGVYLLLRRLQASEQEQIAGLLHDISHLAFSHVVDIVWYSQEQDLHEQLKERFLLRPDIRTAIEELGYAVPDMLAEHQYTLLEQPLPALCADRIDYSLRDAIAVGEISAAGAQGILDDLLVHKGKIVMQSPAAGGRFGTLFQHMNDTWWASQLENYLYESLAQAIEIGLESGVIDRDDLMGTDDEVERKLRGSGDARITALFNKLEHPPIAEVESFVPLRPIKQRSIDPHVWVGGNALPLSELLKHQGDQAQVRGQGQGNTDRLPV